MRRILAGLVFVVGMVLFAPTAAHAARKGGYKGTPMQIIVVKNDLAAYVNDVLKLTNTRHQLAGEDFHYRSRPVKLQSGNARVATLRFQTRVRGRKVTGGGVIVSDGTACDLSLDR